jgi:hypothetical protein
MCKEGHRRELKLKEEFMRRSPVKVGATCAAILLSSVAYAQQPKSPSQAPQAQTRATCLQYKDVPRATWTLFLVAVPYNGPWTITAVAAFSDKDAAKDTACSDCFAAMSLLNNGNKGIPQETADAKRAEGIAQYLICLPATAPTQRGGGSGGGGASAQ